MPRSLKKGPFVDDHLLKKVDVQNEKNTKQVIKTGRGGRPLFPTSSVTRSPSTTAQACGRCSSPKRWWATNWVNSRRRAPSRGHIKDDRKAKRR